MLEMLRKLTVKKEQRNGMETKGFLSRDDFADQLIKERARADRAGASFTLLAFDVETPPGLNGKAEAMEILASILVKRARLTDTKGWFGNRLGIILPNTGTENANNVVQPIQELFKKTAVANSPHASTTPKIAYQAYEYPTNGTANVSADVVNPQETGRLVPVA